MRDWIKGLIRETLREFFYDNFEIVANRPPHEKDHHPRGTTWRCGEDLYMLFPSKMNWKKIEKPAEE